MFGVTPPAIPLAPSFPSIFIFLGPSLLLYLTFNFLHPPPLPLLVYLSPSSFCLIVTFFLTFLLLPLSHPLLFLFTFPLRLCISCLPLSLCSPETLQFTFLSPSPSHIYFSSTILCLSFFPFSYLPLCLFFLPFSNPTISASPLSTSSAHHLSLPSSGPLISAPLLNTHLLVPLSSAETLPGVFAPSE